MGAEGLADPNARIDGPAVGFKPTAGVDRVPSLKCKHSGTPKGEIYCGWTHPHGYLQRGKCSRGVFPKELLHGKPKRYGCVLLGARLFVD